MGDLYAAVASCAVATGKNEQGELRGKFTFPTSFIGFAGHFPGMPVLPGIVQMMAVLYTCVSCGLPARMAGVTSCKFVQPVFPEQEMSVIVTLPDDGQGKTLQALTRAGGAVCAEMVLLVDSAFSGAAV